MARQQLSVTCMEMDSQDRSTTQRRWLRSRHVSMASSGVVTSLLLVLLILQAQKKNESINEIVKGPLCFDSICVKPCRIVRYCLCIYHSNSSRHVFLFNYEILYLKGILWRFNMPKCVGIECKINLNNRNCYYEHTFGAVTVCYNRRSKLGNVHLYNSRNNMTISMNSTLFVNTFDYIMLY